MKKRFLPLLWLGVAFLGCKTEPKGANEGLISDLGKDFPVVEKLKFESFNKYEIGVEIGGSVVDGNVLWHFESGEDNKDFGWCYNLNTGEKLGVLALRGEGKNDLMAGEWFQMAGDSVTLYQDRGTMKIFAKKDIVGGMPVEERNGSMWKAPEGILISQAVKLPDGTVLATVRPPMFEFELAQGNELNQKTIVLFGKGGTKAYDVIDYDSFDLGKATEAELSAEDLLRWNYAQGCVAVKDDSTVVFSVDGQFILYTWDVNTGKTLAEKRYTKAERDGGEMSLVTTNENKLSIQSVTASDRYIVCDVTGYFSDEAKEAKKAGRALFVFDWDLEPVKRFDLALRDEEGYYRVATDCSAVYFCKQSGEHELTLYKADLNI